MTTSTTMNDSADANNDEHKAFESNEILEDDHDDDADHDDDDNDDDNDDDDNDDNDHDANFIDGYTDG